MSTADWGVVVVMFFSVLLAAAQGFFFEVFSLAGAVLGYVIAAWGYGTVASWYRPYVTSPWIADIAGYLTIFLVAILLGGMVGRTVRWAVQGVGLRWFDRLLGAAFGLLRGVVVVTVIALGLAAFAPQSRLLRESRSAPYLLVIGRGASWLAPPQVRQRFRAGVESLRQFQRERDGITVQPKGRL